MTERAPWADRSALRWVGAYTQGLPEDTVDRRRGELASDLFEHRTAQGETRGQQLQVFGRVLWGIPADLSWRRAAKAPRERRFETGADMTLRRTSSTVFLLYAVFMALTGLGAVNADGGGWNYAVPILIAAGMIVIGVATRGKAPRPSTVLLVIGSAAPAFVYYWMAVLFVPAWIGLIALAVASEPGRRPPSPATT